MTGGTSVHTARTPATRPRSWVLVDFENTVLSAAEKGFMVSFSQLRDFLRGFGDIVFAEVFVGPKHRTADHVLSDAQWRVIACPQSRKEQDAVDAILLESVQRIIAHFQGSIDQLIVVSRDQELIRSIGTAAKDRGILVLTVDILRVRNEVEGEDAAPQIYVGPEVKHFTRMLRDYAEGVPGGLTAEEPSMHLPFAKDVVRILALRNESKKFSFRMLEEYVDAQLDPRWNKFKRLWLRAALTALVHSAVIRKNQNADDQFTYYTLDRNHKLVVAMSEANQATSQNSN